MSSGEALAEEDAVHIISDTETVNGPSKKHEFQAETRQLLDIVARSLYSEKEVFIREIISNSSDALEKVRHKQVTGAEIEDESLPLEIHLTTDEEKNLFVIQDFGIGMTEDELVENLGTIARSGSKKFVEQAMTGESTGPQDAMSSIIGQFGVGFYSTFMVGSKIDVYSKSSEPGSKGYMWTSDGAGTYEIAEADGVSRGTKVIIHLKDEDNMFAMKARVEDIIRRYSNFVGFPIYLNGTKLNTIGALWMQSDRDVEDEDHSQFYQFITNTSDTPRYQFMYKADAPLNIRSVFYVPTSIPEMYGFGRMEHGVSLYCRKVMIQSKAEKILPDWLRFMRGVVDSEDIPLNLSRELLQDSALIKKLSLALQRKILRFMRGVVDSEDIPLNLSGELLQDSALIKKLSLALQRKILRFFQEQSRKDPEKYEKFLKECGNYFREGMVSVQGTDEKEEIAKLLRFESSKERAGKMRSLDEYVKDMKEDQKDIFYLCAPNRELAESSPYFEALKAQDVEVLFTYDENDEVVMAALKEFNKKEVTSAENFLMKTEDKKKDADDEQASSSEVSLTEVESQNLMNWIQTTLGKSKVNNIRVSNRLASHPAMITVPDMGAARRWLKFVKSGPNSELLNMKFDVLQPTVEINPSHEVIRALYKLKSTNPMLAELLANQLFDNAMITAGLMDDPREMVGRLNSLLSKVLTRLTVDDEKPSAS